MWCSSRSENAKKLLRRETGVTERGGQFDELKTFDATEWDIKKLKNFSWLRQGCAIAFL